MQTSWFDVHRFPRPVTYGFTVVASVGVVAAAAVNCASYGPADWGPTLMNVALGLFPAIFPLFFLALGAVLLSRTPVGVLIGDVPGPVKAAGVLVFLYVFANFFLTLRLLPTAAQQQSGSDPQGFMYAARLFSGHEMVFFGICAVIGYELERVRSGRLKLNVGPRDDAIEQHPLPLRLSRTLTLQTMLTADECAQRLQKPIPQGFFSYLGRYGVRGEVNPSGFRLELGGPQASMVYAVGHFEGGGRPTFVRVLLTFKRWAVISLGVAILIYPALWLVLSSVGFPFSPELLLFFLVVGIGGNFLFGLWQMSSLLNQIQRATDSQPVSLG
ncbi:MAG TPA: hypothetical protein VJQ08_13455 [Candidatus Dormibacteraeota bacterium]|nr:hypothetical protein [Candidatus Dormibacteraeota bacterium]